MSFRYVQSKKEPATGRAGGGCCYPMGVTNWYNSISNFKLLTCCDGRELFYFETLDNLWATNAAAIPKIIQTFRLQDNRILFYTIHNILLS